MSRQLWIELPVASAEAGRPYVVLVEEPSAEAWADGVPDVLLDPRTDCYQKLDEDGRRAKHVEWQRWLDRLLARMIVEPTFLKDPERIAVLGADREALARRVQEWLGVRPKAGEPDRRNFLHMVRKLARHKRCWPAEVMALPASEFWFNWRVLFGDELAANAGLGDLDG